MAEDYMVNQPDAVIESVLQQGPMVAMAMDIPRLWSTGAQVLVNPDFSILIFREQNQVEFQGPGVDKMEPQLLVKNVASVVMPTAVLREVSRLLVQQLEAVSEDG